MNGFIYAVGADLKSNYVEIETEARSVSTTREDFWNEVGDEENSNIDFLAIYNSANDSIVMQNFIDNRTGKSSNQKTNSDEIKNMLNDWLSGSATGDQYSVTRHRVTQIRQRYFRHICAKIAHCSAWGNYEEFSRWLKERRKNL